MDLKNKKVVVLGAARSGIASALFLKKKGAEVFVSEKKESGFWIKDKKRLEKAGIKTEAGKHTEQVINNTDLIVLSPGIPPDIPVLKEAEKDNIPVISEIELGFSFCPAPIIAVGGTNGKTTTTTLLGKVFKKAKRQTVVAGNIGTSFIGQIEKITSNHIVILEISSFQLETIKNFRPKIGITLNLTQDHLDRYSSMKEYSLAKQRIFLNQTKNDYTVLNLDDEEVAEWAKKTKGKTVFFSTKKHVCPGAFLKGNDVMFFMDGSEEKICSVNDIQLPGEHNLSNILAVIIASKLENIPSGILRNVIKSFKGLEHRIEFVRELKGVRFYNDSKGTNVDSVIKALESFDTPVVIIAGGQDKNSDFSVLNPLIKKKIRALILIGEAKGKIKDAIGELTETFESDNLENAVKKAYDLAKAGDIVLLSPGCASFDMFRDYEDRGEKFKEAVKNL